MKADTSTHAKEVQQASEGGVSCPLYIAHPVSQKKKKVYHTDQTTFILGETPRGVRRYVAYDTLDSKSDSQRKHSSLGKQTILMLAIPGI